MVINPAQPIAHVRPDFAADQGFDLAHPIGVGFDGGGIDKQPVVADGVQLVEVESGFDPIERAGFADEAEDPMGLGIFPQHFDFAKFAHGAAI